MNANLSAWAIRKPLPSILLFFILTVAGVYSFSRLPVTYFPTIIAPLVKVTVEQPGAAAAELETEVAKLVEDAVASLPGLKELSSKIGQGRSVTSVEFEVGEVTPDRALVDVRDAIARIRSDLPPSIDEPVIERVEEDGQSVVTYAVASHDMTVAELSWFVDDIVARQLQGLPGVGSIERVGGADREIRIELDADRLHAFSLSANTVNDTLVKTQVDASGGRSDISGREQALKTTAAATTVAGLADQRIAMFSDASVRLSDLGRVQDTVAEPRSFATLDGEDVVGFSVYRTQGASDVSVAAVIEDAVHKLRTSHANVGFRLVSDNVAYTAGNYSSAMHTLAEGAVLSIIVVFVFLRDWRATAVAAVALPLSIIPTFFVLELLGFSLNMLSLLAITLVTGILVDDAIVEIENVVRHRNMGKSAYRAALDASDEIGLAVIAISGTIIAVFVPVGMMSGVVGLYFREFGLTVAIAVFFSLLVARLITPVLAAYLMTSSPSVEEPKGCFIKAYERLLRFSLRWRWITVGVAMASFALAMMALLSLPTTFLPEEDTGQLTLAIELPPGSTLKETREVADEVSRRIGKFEEVQGAFIQAGSSMSGQHDVRFATVLVDLTHKSARSRSSFEIEADMKYSLASIVDTKLRFLNSRGGRDMSFALLGADGDRVQEAANRIVKEMATDSTFVAPAAENAAMRPELRFKVQTEKAAMLGLSAADIADLIRVSTIGDSDTRLPIMLDRSRQIPIRTVLDARSRNDLRRLELLTVGRSDGTRIPLTAVVDISFDETISVIERSDRSRLVEIGADMAAGVTSGQGMERLMELRSIADLPAGVRIQATGDSDTEGSVFESFAIAMVSGIMLVLVVLILLFGSLLAPWTILASLPLSIGGVAAGLLVSNNAVSLPVVIGILMLMGIVTKNAIMLLDFAIEREAHGLPRFEAIIEACSERVRPIIMTTLAMAGGMVPSAFAVGDGGEFRSPMAIAVIGGLLVSTMLSLIVIPSLHLIVTNFGDRITQRFKPFIQSTEPVV
ncbi:efflux RND transporter permease subunit [Agrobacterium sp. S2]|nr:efflux RND transporter permease subunit [Agrobacterium sp. S2]